MSTVNVTRPASDGSDDQALLLKMYSGSVTSAFRNMPKIYKRGYGIVDEFSTAGGGKSWQFLMEGDVPDPEEFTPGEEMLGQADANAEGTITCDPYIIAHKYVGIDEIQQSQFNVTSKFGSAHARKISVEADKRIFITLAQAAREAALTHSNGLSIHSGGNRVTRAGGSTTLATALASAYPISPIGAENLHDDIQALAYAMDLDNIPPEQRMIWLTPYARRVLLKHSGAIIGTPSNTITPVSSPLFNSELSPGGNNVNSRTLTTIAGFAIMDFVNGTSSGGSMPDQDLSATTTLPSKYRTSFAPGTGNGTPLVIAACVGPDGQAPVGMVEFEPITSSVKWVEERLSWLFHTRTRCGFGKKEVYCAGSVEVTNN